MPHRYPIASSLALILGCSGGPGSIPADAGVSYYEPPIWGGAFESPPDPKPLRPRVPGIKPRLSLDLVTRTPHPNAFVFGGHGRA